MAFLLDLAKPNRRDILRRCALAGEGDEYATVRDDLSLRQQATPRDEQARQCDTTFHKANLLTILSSQEALRPPSSRGGTIVPDDASVSAFGAVPPSTELP